MGDAPWVVGQRYKRRDGLDALCVFVDEFGSPGCIHSPDDTPNFHWHLRDGQAQIKALHGRESVTDILPPAPAITYRELAERGAVLRMTSEFLVGPAILMPQGLVCAARWTPITDPDLWQFRLPGQDDWRSLAEAKP